MVEKVRLGGEWNFKKIVAVVIFGAIILTFIISGPGLGGRGGGPDGSVEGVAAVVNDRIISLNEFRAQSEQVERNARGRFDQLPEAQRRALTSQMRQNVLNQLIATEVVYQAAEKHGVIASDNEVKEQILQLQFLQENGHFNSERYRQFLQSMGLGADEFERQIRKQIVVQKLQELFVGSAAPTSEEIKRNRALGNQKIGLRFAAITKDELGRIGGVTDADVKAYVTEHKADIEAYYKDNQIEFAKPERYRSRDIMIGVGQKRSDAEALKLAEEVKKQATPANFAKLAAKYSDDTLTKNKGGDNGEQTRGGMMPEYEEAALALKPGEISNPIKIEGSYHILFLESRAASETPPLAQVESLIARKLLSRAKEDQALAKLRETVQKGDRKSVEALVAQAGAKWQDSGEFDLSATSVPKLEGARDLVTTIMKNGKQTGLVKELVADQGRQVVVDVTSWKEVAEKATDPAGLDRLLAYRKAEGPLEAWVREIEGHAKIERNLRLLQ